MVLFRTSLFDPGSGLVGAGGKEVPMVPSLRIPRASSASADARKEGANGESDGRGQSIMDQGSSEGEVETAESKLPLSFRAPLSARPSTSERKRRLVYSSETKKRQQRRREKKVRKASASSPLNAESGGRPVMKVPPMLSKKPSFISPRARQASVSNLMSLVGASSDSFSLTIPDSEEKQTRGRLGTFSQSFSVQRNSKVSSIDGRKDSLTLEFAFGKLNSFVDKEADDEISDVADGDGIQEGGILISQEGIGALQDGGLADTDLVSSSESGLSVDKVLDQFNRRCGGIITRIERMDARLAKREQEIADAVAGGTYNLAVENKTVVAPMNMLFPDDDEQLSRQLVSGQNEDDILKQAEQQRILTKLLSVHPQIDDSGSSEDESDQLNDVFKTSSVKPSSGGSPDHNSGNDKMTRSKSSKSVLSSKRTQSIGSMLQRPLEYVPQFLQSLSVDSMASSSASPDRNLIWSKTRSNLTDSFRSSPNRQTPAVQRSRVTATVRVVERPDSNQTSRKRSKLAAAYSKFATDSRPIIVSSHEFAKLSNSQAVGRGLSPLVKLDSNDYSSALANNSFGYDAKTSAAKLRQKTSRSPPKNNHLQHNNGENVPLHGSPVFLQERNATGGNGLPSPVNLPAPREFKSISGQLVAENHIHSTQSGESNFETPGFQGRATKSSSPHSNGQDIYIRSASNSSCGDGETRSNNQEAVSEVAGAHMLLGVNEDLPNMLFRRGPSLSAIDEDLQPSSESRGSMQDSAHPSQHSQLHTVSHHKDSTAVEVSSKPISPGSDQSSRSPPSSRRQSPGPSMSQPLRLIDGELGNLAGALEGITLIDHAKSSSRASSDSLAEHGISATQRDLEQAVDSSNRRPSSSKNQTSSGINMSKVHAINDRNRDAKLEAEQLGNLLPPEEQSHRLQAVDEQQDSPAKDQTRNFETSSQNSAMADARTALQRVCRGFLGRCRYMQKWKSSVESSAWLQQVLEKGLIYSQFQRRKVYEVVKSLKFFREKAKSNISICFQLCGVLEFAEYTKDEVVVRQGDDSDSLYILFSGECHVFVSRISTTKPVAVLEEGDSFGELGLIEGKARAATVTAGINETLLLKVSKLHYRRFLKGFDNKMVAQLADQLLSVGFFTSEDRKSLIPAALKLVLRARTRAFDARSLIRSSSSSKGTSILSAASNNSKAVSDDDIVVVLSGRVVLEFRANKGGNHTHRSRVSMPWMTIAEIGVGACVWGGCESVVSNNADNSEMPSALRRSSKSFNESDKTALLANDCGLRLGVGIKGKWEGEFRLSSASSGCRLLMLSSHDFHQLMPSHVRAAISRDRLESESWHYSRLSSMMQAMQPETLSSESTDSSSPGAPGARGLSVSPKPTPPPGHSSSYAAGRQRVFSNKQSAQKRRLSAFAAASL